MYLTAIIGESASGKTTLVDKFCEKWPDFHKVVTYTTRDKRENEVDGKDYHFISEAEFEEKSKADFFIEEAEYNGWSYGISKEDCDDDFSIIIVTPAGYRTLKRYGVNVEPIYLYVDRRSRLIASLLRGDDIEEAYRRNVSDVGMFDGFADEAFMVIDNTRFEKNHEQLMEQLGEYLYDLIK